MNACRLAIVGCCGRMGRALVRLAMQDAEVRLAAAVTRADDAELGRDAGAVAGLEPIGLRVSATLDDALQAAGSLDGLIEFASPDVCVHWARWCAANQVPFVSGTTGLTAQHRSALAEAAAKIPVLWSPNMSVGVNLLLKLVADAARALGPSWNIEIVETHHAQKVDAPSGTANLLLDAVCAARGASPADVARHGRSGPTGPRSAEEIGVHALRLGDEVGAHQVHFAAAGESLALQHRATSRDVFARGALLAAKWLDGRPPRLYSMRDVLTA